MFGSVSVQIRLAIAIGRLGVVSISVGQVSVGVRMHDRCDTIAIGNRFTIGHRFAICHRLNGSRIGRIAPKWNAALRVVLRRSLDTLDLAEQTVVRIVVGIATSIAFGSNKNKLALDVI